MRVPEEARPLRQLHLERDGPRGPAVPGLGARPGEPVAERVPRGGGVARVQELCGREPAEAEGAGEFFFLFIEVFF